MVKLSLSAQARTKGRIHGDQETVQCYFRQHWMRLAPPFLGLLAGSAVLGFTGYLLLVEELVTDRMTQRIALVLLLSLFYLLHVDFLNRLYRYFLNIVVITDKRLHRIKRTLLIINDHQTVDLWGLQDIRKRQHGVIQNVFGFGTLVLEAPEEKLRLHFTPHVDETYILISLLRQQNALFVAAPPPRPPVPVVAPSAGPPIEPVRRLVRTLLHPATN